MASVDDIFKLESPASGNSTLSEIQLIPLGSDEIYKSAKLSSNGTDRHARVDAEPEQDDEEQDFGPAMPPDEADDNADEEGRFFGGGITQQESRILDYVDEADAGAAPDKIDAAWLRKTALAFEKHITKNAELRAKFENDPQKFIGSEADLDADIKGLSVLTEHPELYPEFVGLGCVESLVGLLAHDNTDIAIDAIELLGELTDEDVEAEDDQWNTLVDGVMAAGLLELLISNLSRFNEDDETDRSGVYHSLGMVENLCSRPAIAAQIGPDTKLLRWLLARIQRTEAAVTQNKQYAAEILAILAQSGPESRRAIVQLDAVDALLQLVAQYRKRDPDKGTEEEEYMENLFEALTCLVDEEAGKKALVDAEGVELCLIMLKEGKMSKPPALRLLDHASSGSTGAAVCQKLVEAGGLKTTFTLFNKTNDNRLLSHLVAIFASMLRLLPADSAERIRTLAKFVEKDYEKISKLIKLHGDYSTRMRQIEQDTARELRQTPAEEVEVTILMRRLDAGLATLQTVDTILAWLVAEDGGARQRISKLLASRDEDLSAIKAVLTEYLSELDAREEDTQELTEMLGTLIEFL
ncbi:DUF1716 domain-containing protein [Stachybotrys elegans]|uniref:DUF1716 domain-containing protein n=1 Tax=Stachybotrys elegans TaxID=80388 RepID=A0A8K0WPG7_9HYPO|nr:DUF1716 domain-containing protein [Stachybotrys elegans]